MCVHVYVCVAVNVTGYGVCMHTYVLMLMLCEV